MTDRVLANINRNGRESLRIAVSEFRGSIYVDLRTYAVSTSGEPVPTRTGITVPPRMLRYVIEALIEAERELATMGGAP